MRIRFLQNPTVPCIDGVRVDHFVPGHSYEVGALLGCVLAAEGWAEPTVADDGSSSPPVSPPNLYRERFPPPCLAGDDDREAQPDEAGASDLENLLARIHHATDGFRSRRVVSMRHRR